MCQACGCKEDPTIQAMRIAQEEEEERSKTIINKARQGGISPEISALFALRNQKEEERMVTENENIDRRFEEEKLLRHSAEERMEILQEAEDLPPDPEEEVIPFGEYMLQFEQRIKEYCQGNKIMADITKRRKLLSENESLSNSEKVEEPVFLRTRSQKEAEEQTNILRTGCAAHLNEPRPFCWDCTKQNNTTQVENPALLTFPCDLHQGVYHDCPDCVTAPPIHPGPYPPASLKPNLPPRMIKFIVEVRAKHRANWRVGVEVDASEGDMIETAGKLAIEMWKHNTAFNGVSPLFDFEVIDVYQTGT